MGVGDAYSTPQPTPCIVPYGAYVQYIARIKEWACPVASLMCFGAAAVQGSGIIYIRQGPTSKDLSMRVRLTPWLTNLLPVR